LLVRGDPINGDGALSVLQRQPVVADEGVQSVLQAILGIGAPAADDVMRLRPEVVRADGRPTELEADEVVFLIVPQA